MLLCGIIEDLKKTPGENSNIGYFFCQATDSRINSASSVVAGLIFSLVKQNPKPFSKICKHYEDKLSQLDGPNAWAVLGDIFEAITQDKDITDLICVVDALDECEHDCKLLLNLIIKTSNHVKWLLSSRNVKDIERGLRLIEPARRLSLELKENAENVSKSVDAYINNSISDIEALEDDEELQIKTVTTLKRKANGTFLWVALVIEQLRDTARRNVEEVLEEIPEGLENLYDLIVQRANAKLRQKDREACQILLSIVTTAERPLHLEELHTFISSQWANYKSSYGILDMKDIVTDCGSLLAIRDDIIYFIHQSVKDYMVGNAYNSIFPSGIQYQHRKMFETSMSAMSRILKQDIYNLKDPQRCMGDKSRKREYGVESDIRPPYPDPLVPIKYSCVFWVDHLIRGYDSEGFMSEECFKGDGLLQTFLKTKYLCWLEALALLRSLTPEGGSALQRLNNQVASYCKSRENEHRVTNPQEEEHTNDFMKLIGDAYRFFHYCQDFVRTWPLQLYYSAILFEDKYSATYKTYRHSTRAHFGDFFTFVKKPQRWCSLQRDIDVCGFFDNFIYSPDSSTLCVFNHHISLYRLDTMELVAQLSVDEKQPHFVSFLPDSRHLVSVSSIGTVQTWVVDSWEQKPQLSLNLGLRELDTVNSFGDFREEVINLSPNGDLAASMSRTSGERDCLSSMKIWATETGVCVCEIDLMHILSHKELYAFAPNSALIALKYDSGIGIYSTQIGNAIKHFSVPDDISYYNSTTCLKFSKDSALLAFANWNDIELWCTKSWTMIRRIKTGDYIQNFDLSLDASLFVATSEKTLVFGSTKTEEQFLKIATVDTPRNVSFSPDWPTSSLLAFDNSETVQIWRVDTRDSPAEMRSTYSASSVTISPGSKYVAARSLEGYINIWSGKSGECIQVLKGGDSNQGYPVFSPNLEFVASAEGFGDDVQIWRLTTGESLHILGGHSGHCWIRTMVFSDDSKYLVIGYDNSEIRVWCTESGKCLSQNNENNNKDGFTFEPRVLAISPGSKYIAGAFERTRKGFGWEVRIWDWRAGHDISAFAPRTPKKKVIYPALGSHIRFYIKSLAFSSDATVLAVICEVERIGSWLDDVSTYEAQIWEVATGTCITHIAIGKSCSLPLFDPTTNKILTDRAAFRKNSSSWEHWEKFPRWAYSIWRSRSDREPWICVGGEKVFLIPEQFSTRNSFDHMAMSSSLLAYLALANEIMIIQLPSQHELQRLGVIALDSDSVGNPSVRDDDLNSEFAHCLATGESDPDKPKARDCSCRIF